MDEKFYEQIGRLYCDIVDLYKQADKNNLYLSGGFVRDGDFYLRVWDTGIKTCYHDLPYTAVTPDTLPLIAAGIGEVRGFICGWVKATAIERKRAEEAAKPEIDFMTGEPVKEEPVAKEAE